MRKFERNSMSLCRNSDDRFSSAEIRPESFTLPKRLRRASKESLFSMSPSIRGSRSSRDFLYGFVKTMNVVSALSHSLSSEKASDAIKAILFNSDELWDGMVSGAKNPEATSLLRLYAMVKDPDISAGLTAALYALKAIGSALRKVPEE